MFTHIFYYRLKCIFNDRITLFWTLAFPLLLATFFNLAFSNLSSGEKFRPVTIAVVDNSAWQENKNFRQVMNEVSNGEDRLFNLNVVSADEADKLLLDYEISGYILVDESISVVVNGSGMNQSIIKSFVDNYMQTFSAVDSIITEDPSNYQRIISSLGEKRNYIHTNALPGGDPNNTVSYFYALIAMSCLYGGFKGMREINNIQANISHVAARVNIAPVQKMKTFLSSSTASLLVQFTEILILLAFMTFVLGIDFGDRTGLVILTSFIGCITGLSFGALVSVLVKKSEGAKIGILISVSMVFSFLAGMMQLSIKYTISQKVPFLSWINPVNLLTDAFYSLYYFDTLSRYTLNIVALLGFILLFCSIIYFIIRRRKYASL